MYVCMYVYVRKREIYTHIYIYIHIFVYLSTYIFYLCMNIFPLSMTASGLQECLGSVLEGRGFRGPGWHSLSLGLGWPLETLEKY